MAAEYTGQGRQPTLAQCLFGETGCWPEGAAYAAWQRAKLPKLRLGVPDGTPLAAEMDAIDPGRGCPLNTVQEILSAMERLAPPELAEGWDNVGLLVDCGRPVRRVLTALDITPAVLAEAVEQKCELIVAHHPVIFAPLKQLGPEDMPFRLVQAGVSAICMHTNLDAAAGGVNDTLAALFGMQEPEIFADGCGRVGQIAPLTVPQLAQKASSCWRVNVTPRPAVRLCR